MHSFKVDSGARVNIYDVSDVKRWCEKFGCTKQQLWDAVATVGTSAEAVRNYLSNARHGVLAGSPSPRRWEG